ncbi:TIGR03545 family protein [bacterium]
MRWKGLITFIAIMVLLTIITMIFIDQWIETGLEKAGEAMVGACVDIDALDFNLFNLSIEYQRLQITDPKNTMKNVIETGRTAYRMNLPALLRKRIVIEEMALENVRSGTKRAFDGKLPKKKKRKSKTKPGIFDKAKEKLSGEINSLPVLQFNPDQWKQKLNLDSLIVMSELTMPQQLDSAKTDIVSTSKNWELFYERFQPEADLEKIKNDFKDLDPNDIKTIPELTSTLKRVQDANKTLKSIQDTVKTRHQQINTDFQKIGEYTKRVDDWYQADYHRILEKAKLPDLSVRNIGMILFGSTIINRVDQYLGTVETIRKYMPKKSTKPKKEKPQRGKGQNIAFPDKHLYPEFLIAKAFISGQTGLTEAQPGIQLSGLATGITSQPWIYGKPTEINLKGIHEDQRTLSLLANLDHTKELSKDHFELIMNAVSLNNVQIVDSKYLPGKIDQGNADIQLTGDFQDEDFILKLNVVARQIRFDFSNMPSDNRFIDIVQDVMNDMTRITLNTQISHQNDNTTLKMDSNLDEQVSTELKRMGSKALTDAQNKVKGRLNSVRNEKMKEVNQIYDQKKDEIVGKIETYEEKVEEQRLMIEAKIEKIKEDIETRKKKEEGKLKKKAKGLLDNVLN